MQNFIHKCTERKNKPMLLYSSITFDQEHVDLSVQIHVPRTLLYYFLEISFQQAINLFFD